MQLLRKFVLMLWCLQRSTRWHVKDVAKIDEYVFGGASEASQISPEGNECVFVFAKTQTHIHSIPKGMNVCLCFECVFVILPVSYACLKD